MGLNINFQKTKAFFINSDSNTLVVWHQQIQPVSDFRYLGSMIACPVEDLKRDVCGLAWTVFWRLETVWRSKTLSIATKLRLCDSLVVAIMLCCGYKCRNDAANQLFCNEERKRSERRKQCARAGCSKVRTPPAHPPARCKHTNPQTGPITMHCAAAS